MGRAFFIKHRTSHLTIAVSDEVNGTRRLTRPRHMRSAGCRPPPRRRRPRPAARTPAGPDGVGDAGGKGRAKPKEKN